MSTKWSNKALNQNGGVDFGDLLKEEYAVVLLQGKNVFGDLIYSYLKVALPDIPRLQAALQSHDPFNASDFGSVVAAGKGEPTAEIKAEIASNYPMYDQPKELRPKNPLVNPEEKPALPPEIKKAWDEY